jgi:DNA-binding transcriptional LysR family regulator
VAELRTLKAFLAVAHHGTFTQAADELGLTQQAISRAVASLEAELGVTLLTRHARGARPTAAGASLLHDAQEILADLEIALDRARHAADGSRGLLRIATTPAIVDAELTPLVDAMRADVPAAELSFVEIRPRQIAGALRNDDVDIVLARTLPTADDIEVHELSNTPARLALATDHRLARRRKLRLDELAGERLIVWSTRSPHTDLLLGFFADVPVTPVTSKVLGRPFGAEVAAGEGVAIVPEGTPPAPGVKLVAIDPPPLLPVRAALRRWSARPLATRFVALAKQHS